jgi:hypothetical protein
MSGIYAIVSPSGNLYIGNAKDTEKRWNQHRSALRKGVHHSTVLQRAIAQILHFGLCALKARVPWIVSPHFGQMCGTGEWGGLVCEARRIWAAVNGSIITSGAYLLGSNSPIKGGCESGHEMQSNNQKPMLPKYAEAVTVNPSLIMCVKGFGVLDSRSLSRRQYANRFIFLPQFPIYTHYAMCQGGY